MTLALTLLFACGSAPLESEFRAWTEGAACSNEFFDVFSGENPDADPSASFAAATAGTSSMVGSLDLVEASGFEGLLTIGVEEGQRPWLKVEDAAGEVTLHDLSADSYWCDDGTFVGWRDNSPVLTDEPLLIIGQTRTASPGEAWWYQGAQGDAAADVFGPEAQVIDTWMLEGALDSDTTLDLHVELLPLLAEANHCRTW